MVGSIQYGIFNLYSQVAGRGFFFFSLREWNNAKKSKKIRFHYQNKKAKTGSYSRPQEYFLLSYFTSWLPSDFLHKNWLDPLFLVLNWKL